MSGLGRRWRGVALVPAGLFAVHQLRLLLEFGSGEGGLSTAHGHLHIASLLPWVVIALAAALGGLLTHVARGLNRAGTEPSPSPSLRALWAATAATLLGLHALHEGLEGLFLHGAGLAGLAGIGGLCAALAVIAISGLIALGLRGARSLIAVIARARRLAPARGEAGTGTIGKGRALRLLGPPLSRSAAGRAPPPRPRLAA